MIPSLEQIEEDIEDAIKKSKPVDWSWFDSELENLQRRFGASSRSNVSSTTRMASKERLDRIKGLRAKVQSLQVSRKGTGIRYYSGSNELVERLHLCCGRRQAGNNNGDLRNEIEEILTTLLRDVMITKDH